MAGIDPSRQFVPLSIAVLTLSDTRNLGDDKSGALLVERIEKAGHAIADRAMFHADNGYFLENVTITSHRCRTNMVSIRLDANLVATGDGFESQPGTREMVRCATSPFFSTPQRPAVVLPFVPARNPAKPRSSNNSAR
jgi:hypothetical protein